MGYAHTVSKKVVCSKAARKILFSIIGFVFTDFFATAQSPVAIEIEKFPIIDSLNSRNPVCIQYCDDVENAYKAFAAGKKPQQFFYVYKAVKGDTLFSIAAQCSIPYETIATVNALPQSQFPIEGISLLLPTVAGIFITDTPKNDIEILLRNKYDSVFEENSNMLYTIKGRTYCFLEQERFDPTIRAFFLDSGMKLPVKHGILTSPFGMRKSPISGKWKFHKGIDLAVPVGTPVFACRNGIVLQCRKNDSVFGNYIVLKHDNGMTSIYAHLSRILVTEGTIVNGGSKIGLSGSSGESTGPHLHFEIRINGISTDPVDMVPVK